MIILLSPAKSLDFSPIQLDLETTEVRFNKETKKLVNTLKKKNVEQIQKLMHVSEKIAKLNKSRYNNYSNNYDAYNSKPSVFAFNGDVYQGLNASSLSRKNIVFSQTHLRILSGLYGLLRPLDKIQPYRLEMGTKLKVYDANNLYQFWGRKIFHQLKKDLSGQKNNLTVINLASIEYYKVVKPYLESKQQKVSVINVKFLDKKNDAYKTIAFFSKKARGLMARYIIQNEISEYKQLAQFNLEGYYYDKDNSTPNSLIFKRSIKL